mmetsp:Transcript_27781/g.62652  ORF Transcript_27781/g.62652 Transcript_27781/m.62652 type:complete len:106 (-) Transcript_27781:34-351(-)
MNTGSAWQRRAGTLRWKWDAQPQIEALKVSTAGLEMEIASLRSGKVFVVAELRKTIELQRENCIACAGSARARCIMARACLVMSHLFYSIWEINCCERYHCRLRS